MANLKSLTIKGVRWTAFSTIFLAAIQPLLLITKARFLTPEEFAYISIIMIVIGLLNHLEGQAFNQALIQRDHIEIEEASSLLFFNIFLSAIVAGLLFLSSPYIALFLNLPDLNLYLKIISITVFLQGPLSLYRTCLQKNFLFREIALINIIRSAVNFLFVVTFLFLGWGLMAVVWGQILSAVLSLAMAVYWVIVNKGFIVRLYFRLASLKPFIRFGAFVFITQSFSYSSKRVDELLIAYFLDPDVLGVYYFGKNMLEKIRGLLVKGDAKITFPLFSRLKNDINRQSQVYYKVNRLKGHVVLPVYIGIALTAHLFVPVVFGSQWLESIVVFQVMALVFVYRLVIMGSSGYLLYSVNRPDLYLYVQMISDILYIGGLLLFISHGLAAVLVLFSLHSVIQATLCQYLAHRYLVFRFHQYLALFKNTFIFTCIMTIAVMGFQSLNLSQINLAELIGSIAIGSAVYVAMTWFFDRANAKELLALIKVKA